MSTTTLAPRAGRHQAMPVASPFTGVGSLIRLATAPRPRPAQRVDRGPDIYHGARRTPSSWPTRRTAQRMARVNLLKTPAGMMLGGPMFGGNETDLGAMMANELMLTLIIAASILSILTVIRHARAEEESGAAELVLSSVVGRYARTYAALILVGGVNAVLAVAMTLAMAATGFAVVDTAAMCLGVTGVSMVFGAVAAVTAQLWRQARTGDGGSDGHAAHWPRWCAESATSSTIPAAPCPGSPPLPGPSRCVRSSICGGGRSPCWSCSQSASWRWPRCWRAGGSYDDGVIPSDRRATERASDQERIRPASDAATRSDDQVDRRIVPVRLDIRVDDEVAAGRGAGERTASASAGAAGHRRRVYDDDPVPGRGGHRLRRSPL